MSPRGCCAYEGFIVTNNSALHESHRKSGITAGEGVGRRYMEAEPVTERAMVQKMLGGCLGDQVDN